MLRRLQSDAGGRRTEDTLQSALGVLEVLGRLPLQTADRLHEVISGEWGNSLIRGWDEGWMDLPVRLGDKIARLIGADCGFGVFELLESATTWFCLLAGRFFGNSQGLYV